MDGLNSHHRSIYLINNDLSHAEAPTSQADQAEAFAAASRVHRALIRTRQAVDARQSRSPRRGGFRTIFGTIVGVKDEVQKTCLFSCAYGQPQCESAASLV